MTLNDISEDILREHVNTSTTWIELTHKCRYNCIRGNQSIIKRCNILGIDYSHITNNKKKDIRNRIYTMDEILVENSDYYNMISLKNRLIKEKKWKYECSICKLSEWMGKKIPIQLDHINGNHFDNRIENLRFICPNCHAQTDTYAGKNIKRETIAKHKIEKYCECGKKIHYQSNTCNKCAVKIRKETLMKDKPSYETLLTDLETMTFVAVGKKYNVSDNAIRKWIKYYEK